MPPAGTPAVLAAVPTEAKGGEAYPVGPPRAAEEEAASEAAGEAEGKRGGAREGGRGEMRRRKMIPATPGGGKAAAALSASPHSVITR